MNDTIRLATTVEEASPGPTATWNGGTAEPDQPRAGRKAGDHPWRLRPSCAYLKALREADRTVARALVRRVARRQFWSADAV